MKIFRALFFLLSTLLSPGLLLANIVINEIMPAPEGDEPEWVEIYNNTDSLVVLLSPSISDAVGSKSLEEITLNGREFSIICADTQKLKTMRDIPRETILIQNSLPQFNNTSDMVILKSSDGGTIDSIVYDMSDYEKGKSIERINSTSDTYSKDNWGTCIDLSGATAGVKNSLSAPDTLLDISVDIDYNGYYPLFNIKISNQGLATISESNIRILADTIFLHDIHSSLSLIHDELPTLNPGASLDNSYEFESELIIGGKFRCYFVIENKQGVLCIDSTEVLFPIPGDDLFINEIMYDTDNTEFIELINIGSAKINLADCQFSDRAKLESALIINADFVMNSGGYGLICWDNKIFSQFPEFVNDRRVYCSEETISLNNSDDIIVIRDFNGKCIDSLEYFDKWHNADFPSTKNVSLEKTKPDGVSTEQSFWGSCLDISGNTALERNSNFAEPVEGFGLEISPNPFSSNIDGLCKIGYQSEFNGCYLIVQVFNRAGQCVAKLKRGEYSTATGYIEWDGKNNEGFLLPADAYILYFELDPDTGANSIIRKEIVVMAE